MVHFRWAPGACHESEPLHAGRPVSGFLLLLLLALGGADYLLPYWRLIRNEGQVLHTAARVSLLRLPSEESANQFLYGLRGEAVDEAGRKLVFDIFPWHTDNTFGSPESAQQALREAGLAGDSIGSVVVVHTWRGKSIFGTGRMSVKAVLQVKLWTLVACTLPAVGAAAWAIQ